MLMPANQIGIGHRIVVQGKSFIIYSISKKDQEITFGSKLSELKVTVNHRDMIKIINKKGVKNESNNTMAQR